MSVSILTLTSSSLEPTDDGGNGDSNGGFSIEILVAVIGGVLLVLAVVCALCFGVKYYSGSRKQTQTEDEKESKEQIVLVPKVEPCAEDWQCTMCTVTNQAFIDTCYECGTEKNTRPREQQLVVECTQPGDSLQGNDDIENPIHGPKWVVAARVNDGDSTEERVSESDADGDVVSSKELSSEIVIPMGHTIGGHMYLKRQSDDN